MHKPLFWLLSFALVACGDDSSAPGDTESSTGDSVTSGPSTSSASTQATLSGSQTESGTESGTSTGSTTDEPGSDTTEQPSSSEPSTGEPTTTGDTESSTGSSGSDTTASDSSDSSSSSGALVCDIVEVVDAAAVGKQDPVDCGFVTLGDPLDAWEAAHDCVLENFEAESAFTCIAQYQGIDSEIHFGYAGSVGETYIASQFFADSFMGMTIYGTTPCNIAAVGGCVVAVGDLCLECVDPPDGETVCQD